MSETASPAAVWLNKTEAAELLRVKRKQFLERIATRPGFPKAFVLSSHHWLWKKEEIELWISKHQK